MARAGRSEREEPGVPPGVLASCALLTVLTGLIALTARHAEIERPLRVLYFAVLFSAFQAIGRRHREARVLPFRLVEAGLLVLTVSQAAATTLRVVVDEPGGADLALIQALERGAVFLLGLTLLSYGLIVWAPALVESQRVLGERWRRTQGRLQVSEQARSRMEQRIVEADRLHALGELAAGVAHDLRNPLAIVKATADSMRRRSRSPDELAAHTDVICRNIDRAERTIAALLEVGKPRQPELRRVDVDRVVADVMALLTVEARRRRVEVSRHGPRQVEAVTDHRLLSQALLNLVLNALQVSEPGSEVDLVTRRFSIGGVETVALAVQDRGHGLDPGRRDKLFTPFFTTRSDGTGLGLLSARRIVEDLGGRVGLFPRRGGGARALVLLQATEAREAREASA